VQKNHHPTITVRNGTYPFFLKRGKDGKEGMAGGDDGEEGRRKKKMVERERERERERVYLVVVRKIAEKLHERFVVI